MADGDWDHVTVLRKKTTAGQQRSSQSVNAARRTGQSVETVKKFAGGGNQQHRGDLNSLRLDEETEQLSHKTVGLSVGRVILQGRQAKGLTQKQLATSINEKPQIIAELEQGKSIPNQQVLGKIERKIGLKLRGKNIGQPLAAPAPKGKKK